MSGGWQEEDSGEPVDLKPRSLLEDIEADLAAGAAAAETEIVETIEAVPKVAVELESPVPDEVSCGRGGGVGDQLQGMLDASFAEPVCELHAAPTDMYLSSCVTRET